jgi:hypothetical protein
LVWGVAPDAGSAPDLATLAGWAGTGAMRSATGVAACEVLLIGLISMNNL